MKKQKLAVIFTVATLAVSMLSGCGSVAGDYTEELSFDSFLADETGYAFEDAAFTVNASLELGEEKNATYTVEKTEALEEMMDLVLDQIEVPATAVLEANEIAAADYADFDAYQEELKSELKTVLKEYIDAQEDEEYEGTYEAKDHTVSFTSDDFSGDFTLDRSNKDAMTFSGDLEEDWLEDFAAVIKENVESIGASLISGNVEGTYTGAYEITPGALEYMMGFSIGREESYYLQYTLDINDDETFVMTADVESWAMEFQEDVVNNIDAIILNIAGIESATEEELELIAQNSGYESYEALKADLEVQLADEIAGSLGTAEDYTTTGTWAVSEDGTEMVLTSDDGDEADGVLNDGTLTMTMPGLDGVDTDFVFEKMD
ncbi:MAG: hypothetical protein K6G23_07845 [Lachnospiraceae bacterium]|nr:hypothetical protein [Lachnospiraceae bacterium]